MHIRSLAQLTRCLGSTMHRRRVLKVFATGVAGMLLAPWTGRAQATRGIVENLDETASWEDIFCEVYDSSGRSLRASPCGDVPAHDAPRPVDAPSLDGQSLRLTHHGGPSYANVMYYCRLLPDDYPGITDADAFTLALDFRYTPETSFDNAAGVLSRIQALEFAVRLWTPDRMWDWEIQWNVIPTGNGSGPEWNAWIVGGQPDPWVSTGFASDAGLHLAADQWHHLGLDVRRVDGQAWYEGFAINGPPHREMPPRGVERRQSRGGSCPCRRDR
jgi:hypothetical protein